MLLCSFVQVGDLAQLNESEAPKEGHVRVYLVPMRADTAAEKRDIVATSAETVSQVCLRPAWHACMPSSAALLRKP